MTTILICYSMPTAKGEITGHSFRVIKEPTQKEIEKARQDIQLTIISHGTVIRGDLIIRGLTILPGSKKQHCVTCQKEFEPRSVILCEECARKALERNRERLGEHGKEKIQIEDADGEPVETVEHPISTEAAEDDESKTEGDSIS